MTKQAQTGEGKLRVAVNTADGALPVPDASVRVYDGEEAGILYALKTDRSGLTDTIPLPAPPRANSLSPGMPAPFARYIVEVEHPGYGTIRDEGVPVFDGIVSSQSVTLIPLSEFEGERKTTINETEGTNTL